MNLLSIEFVAFFLIVLGLTYIFRRTRLFTPFLFLCNLFFYATFGLEAFLIVIVSILVNYFLNFLVGRATYWRKFFLIVGLLANLAFLMCFKYFDSISLFVTQLSNPESQVNLILFPIKIFGVSYFTLKSISHLYKLYKNEIKLPTIFEFGAFVTFFPQLGAGPIQGPVSFYNQLKIIETQLSISLVNFKLAITLLISGLTKKLLLGTYFFYLYFDQFQNPSAYSSNDLIIGIFAYAFYIYFDFSGYSEIANSISILLGFENTKNFDYPYTATSIKDFWSRWHITLTTWLKENIYIPLGGNRVGKFRKYLNIFIVMLISAIWHGLTWNFLIWGAINGIGLVINHIFNDSLGGRKLNKYFTPLSWLLTFLLINLSWIFFASIDFQWSVNILKGIFLLNIQPSQIDLTGGFLGILFGLILILLEPKISKLISKIFTKTNIVLNLIMLVLILFLIFVLMSKEIPPFIYFSF